MGVVAVQAQPCRLAIGDHHVRDDLTWQRRDSRQRQRLLPRCEIGLGFVVAREQVHAVRTVVRRIRGREGRPERLLPHVREHGRRNIVGRDEIRRLERHQPGP
jgi:hypothetical protein